MAPTTTGARPWPTALATAAVTAVGVGALSLTSAASAQDAKPESFTSTIDVVARSGEVVAETDGDSRATAAFSLQLNSDLDVLCYTITTRGIDPPYKSPARTSTHIHEAAPGASGPPRLVFVDASSSSNTDPRTSSGCAKGPFTTGVAGPDGSDTGTGFTVEELEANPSAYYVDIHTEQFPGGSVRAQLTSAAPATATNAAPAPAAPAPAAPAPAAPAPAAPAPAAPAPTDGSADGSMPTGGVAAGFGGLDRSPVDLPTAAALAAGLLVLGAAGTATAARRVPVVARRRQD